MEFRILGPLEVRDEERPVPITGAKERALLAMLLLHANEAVSTDRLVDALWGEAPPSTARKSLQVRVATLRRALPEDTLVTRGDGYAIRVDGDQLDLHRFERLVARGAEALDGDHRTAAATLREALALWRGPALSDFAYELFAQPAIVRLEELRLAALELRLEADLALGADAKLVGELKALVGEHPLRERLRAQLMLALYRQGRQAEALDVYRQTRTTLTTELGIEPGPALRELHGAILRQEVPLAPAAPERSILVAANEAAGVLALAESLARRPPRELILVDLVSEAADITEAAARLNGWRQGLLERDIAARAVTFTTSSHGDDLVRLAVEQGVDLLLVDGPPDLRSDVVETVLARAPCDVAVHVPRGGALGSGHVLVLFGGSEHDWTALEIGAWIARARESALKIGGPAEGRERDASRALGSASLAVQRVLGIAAEPVLVELADEAILTAAAEAAIVVAGLPERRTRYGLGHVRGMLAERSDAPVLLARRGLRPSGLAPRESLTRFTWTLGPAP